MGSAGLRGVPVARIAVPVAQFGPFGPTENQFQKQPKTVNYKNQLGDGPGDGLGGGLGEDLGEGLGDGLGAGLGDGVGEGHRARGPPALAPAVPGPRRWTR